jgi:hypothetical protein
MVRLGAPVTALKFLKIKFLKQEFLT